MIGKLLPLLAAAVLAVAAPSAAVAQTGSASQKPVDLMEMMGIKVPEGDALERLVEAAAKHPLGSRDNPVRASGVRGQRAYLARLRCADGKRPRFKRAFSAGIGRFGRMMDIYNVNCGSDTRQVYLDLYHAGYVERRPIPGFTVRAGGR